MSIGSCLGCQKSHRPFRKSRCQLFTSDCIECSSTVHWHNKVSSTEKWQEICLGFDEHREGKSTSRTDFPTDTSPKNSYLQVGHRVSKQRWSSKALHAISNILRPRNSKSRRSSLQDQSKSASRISSFVQSDCSSPTTFPGCHCEHNIESAAYQTETQSIDATVNRNDRPNDSSNDVLSLMQNCSETPANPDSQEVFSLKCCCGDVDLTKPSMCGDRACVACNMHDHRYIQRQVSMAAEAAHEAAASVLTVPMHIEHKNEETTSYTSATATPSNLSVHQVLHSVKSALEHRLRCRPDPMTSHLNAATSSSLKVNCTEVATCTTPSTHELDVQPILVTLGKMYQKNLYVSALLHNLSSLDVRKLVVLINECRIKIEQLEDVCKQRTLENKTVRLTDVGVEANDIGEQKCTMDIGVGHESCDRETVDVAVGEEDINNVTAERCKSVGKIDGQTETSNFGVEAGVQVPNDDEFRFIKANVIGSIPSEEWRQLSQGLSSMDIHSLNYGESYVLDPYLEQLEPVERIKSSYPDVHLISSSTVFMQSVKKKTTNGASKRRLGGTVKKTSIPLRPPIRHSSLTASSPRLRSQACQGGISSPQRNTIPSRSFTLPRPLPSANKPAQARFAGGRSVMQHGAIRRGWPVKSSDLVKSSGTKPQSTLRH